MITVRLHNDKREWTLMETENVNVHGEIIAIHTFQSGNDEIRLTDHELEMNREIN